VIRSRPKKLSTDWTWKPAGVLRRIWRAAQAEICRCTEQSRAAWQKQNPMLTVRCRLSHGNTIALYVWFDRSARLRRDALPHRRFTTACRPCYPVLVGNWTPIQACFHGMSIFDVQLRRTGPIAHFVKTEHFRQLIQQADSGAVRAEFAELDKAEFCRPDDGMPRATEIQGFMRRSSRPTTIEQRIAFRGADDSA